MGWGGDVNVLPQLPHIRDATPLHVLLQLPHIRDATLGLGGVGWGGDVNVLLQLPHIRDATPLHVLLQLPHIRDATLGWGGVGMLTFIGTCTHTFIGPQQYPYNKRFPESESENPRELLKTTATFIKQLS